MDLFSSILFMLWLLAAFISTCYFIAKRPQERKGEEFEKRDY